MRRSTEDMLVKIGLAREVAALHAAIADRDEMHASILQTHDAERLRLIAENRRMRDAVKRLLGHAECMQIRYKTSEDRIQAAVDIHFAKQVLLQSTPCPDGAPDAAGEPEKN